MYESLIGERILLKGIALTNDIRPITLSSEELFAKYGRREEAEHILDFWLLGQCLG